MQQPLSPSPQQQPAPLPLITVDEATRVYEVARSTLFLYLRHRRLKRYRRFGDRRTLVNRRELDRLFEPAVLDW